MFSALPQLQTSVGVAGMSQSGQEETLALQQTHTISIRPAFDAARHAILIGEEPRMQTNLQDRMDIADLMTGWIHRDLAQWDDLRTLFHPDGEIEITWFEGKASDFVDASMRMGHRICGRNTLSRRRWWRSMAARQWSKPTW